MVWITRTIYAALALSFCSGCAAANFKPSELANTKNQMVSAALLTDSQKLVYAGRAKKILTSGNDIARVIDDFFADTRCTTPHQLLADPVLVPILSAIPKLLFDLGAQKRARELEALKKASSRAYSVEFVLNKGVIEKANCLAVIRHDAKTDAINAIVLFGISVRNDVVSLEPVTLWARNTIAATRRVNKGQKEKVKFISGATMLGLGTQENKLPILATTGVDVENLGSFSLRDEAPKTLEDGLSIGPLPIPTASKITVLRVSVTESGDVGFNIDEAIARNKTIAEAIGPALKEAAKAYLTDE